MKKYLLITACIIISFSANAQLQKGMHHKIKNTYKPWNPKYLFFPTYWKCFPRVLIFKNVPYKKRAAYGEPIYYLDSDTVHILKNGVVKDSIITKAVAKQIPVPAYKKLNAWVTPKGEDINDTLKIEFWSVNATDPNLNTDKYIRSKDLPDNFIYIIPKRDSLGEPVKFISLPYATWEFGATTVPFKYRFGNGNKADTIPNEATTDINAGLYIGRKWGRSRFFKDQSRNSNSIGLTTALFLSPTVIELKPENTRKAVTSETKELGISTGFAFLLSREDLNFGIVSGVDLPITGKIR